MKKFTFAALAILGLLVGTASLTAPANAASVSLFQPSQSAG